MSLTLIAGLPGSGKTELLRQMEAAGCMVLDEQHPAEQTLECEGWCALEAHLRAGGRGAFATWHLLRPDFREMVESHLRIYLPDVSVNYIWFAPDWHACGRNLIRRHAHDVAEAAFLFQILAEAVRSSRIPADAVLRPVWKPSNE